MVRELRDRPATLSHPAPGKLGPEREQYTVTFRGEFGSLSAQSLGVSVEQGDSPLLYVLFDALGTYYLPPDGQEFTLVVGQGGTELDFSCRSAGLHHTLRLDDKQIICLVLEQLS